MRSTSFVSTPAAEPVWRRALISAILFALFALSAFLALSAMASAQTRSGTIRVEPPDGLPNQPRTIIFSGVWNDACPPGASGLVEDVIGDPKVITINISTVTSLAACAQVLTPYELRFNYQPVRGSGATILAKLNGSTVIGVGKLTVGDLRFPWTDIAGTWIDWTKTTSFLNLSHSKVENVVTGFWGTFDAVTGIPKWYFLHSSRSVSTGVTELIASEYTSKNPSPACLGGPIGSGLCPPFEVDKSKDVFIVRITLQSKDVMSMDVYAIGAGGPPVTDRLQQTHGFSRQVF